MKPEKDDLQGLPSERFPWWMKRLNDNEMIYIKNVCGLGDEDVNEKIDVIVKVAIMKLEDISEDDIWQIADYSAIVARGLDYYETGQVSSMIVSDDGIRAKVKGSFGEYDVGISIEDGEVDVECDCPFKGYGCKHIVAVLYRFINEKGNDKKDAKEQKKIDLDRELGNLDRDTLLSILSHLCHELEDVRRDVLLSMKDNPDAINQGMDMVLEEVRDILYCTAGFIDHNETFMVVKQLDHLKKKVMSVSPDTRVDVLRSIIDGCYDILERCDDSSGSMGDFIIGCLHDLGRSIHEQELTHTRKTELIRDYLDMISREGYGLRMGYERLVMEIPSTDKDLKVLIQELREMIQRHGSDHWVKDLRDMLKEAYQCAGMDEEHLAILKEDLNNSGEFMPLVEFWNDKGELDRAVELAEEGAIKSSKDYDRFRSLDFLKRTYSSDRKWKDLVRVLKWIFEIMPSLERYKEVKEAAQRTGEWTTIKKDIMKSVEGEQLIWIHLHEGNNRKALDQVLNERDRISEDVRKKVAAAIEKEDPAGAIEIYSQLLEENIERKNRTAYRVAALYGKMIRSIYRNMKEEDRWKQYIGSVRERNRTRPAMIQEFSRL